MEGKGHKLVILVTMGKAVLVWCLDVGNTK